MGVKSAGWDEKVLGWVYMIEMVFFVGYVRKKCRDKGLERVNSYQNKHKYENIVPLNIKKEKQNLILFVFRCIDIR